MAASSRSESPHRYGIYGVLVSSELELAELDTPRSSDVLLTPEVTLRLATAESVMAGFSGGGQIRSRRSSPEGPIEVLEGRDGDLLLACAEHGVCHIAADGSAVHCAPPDPRRMAWRRFLLDTVLGTAVLRVGLTGLHAAAVSTPHGVVAIAGATGVGKSTLAAELIRHSGQLFSDDLLFITDCDQTVQAHPGPPLMNLPLDASASPEVGEEIAVLSRDRWVRVRRTPPRPSPLAAVAILDRTASRDPGLEIAPPSLLVSCALEAGRDRARSVRRFETLARIARQVPVVRLCATSAAPVNESAEFLQTLLASGLHAR